MIAKPSPWDAFEVVDHPQQAMGTGSAATVAAAPDPVAAPSAAPPASPFTEFSEAAPVQTVDGGGELTMGADMPETTASRLSDEDTATLAAMMKNPATSASDWRRFVASKGFAGPDNFDTIEDARAHGAALDTDVQYQLPKPVKPAGAVESALFGAGDTAAHGLVDEGTALLDTVMPTDSHQNVWNSDDGFGTLLNRNIDYRRGSVDQQGEDHPFARVAGQILGGFTRLPLAVESAGLVAGRAALREGATMAEARQIAARAITTRLAQNGALSGAAYGAGSGEDGLGGRATGAVVQGGLGAALGAAFGLAGEAAAPKVVARAAAARQLPETEALAFGKAAKRQELDYLAADVPGATKARFATSISKITLGGLPIADAAQKIVAKAAAARDRVANGLGLVGTAESAGQAAQRGAKAFIASTAKRGGDFYEAIPIAADRRVVLTNTRKALSELTQGFESNPTLSRLWTENPRLKATLDALTPETEPMLKPGLAGGGGSAVGRTEVGTNFDTTNQGALSWADMKRFRSIVGEIAGQPGLGADGNQIAAMRKLYAGLSEDMRVTAEANGPLASKAFNRANTYWRGREGRIDNVLSSVLGNDLQKGPQPAFQAINNMAAAKGGNPIMLAKTLRSMPEDEANTVRATILSRMGQASAGRQDAAGEVFSPAEFVTQWNKLSPEAKSILFQGDHRQALNDLATVFAGMKGAEQFANTSKTSIGTNALALAGQFWISPFLGIASGGAQLGAGHLLANPGFARWLAASAKKPNAAAALAHVDKLSKLAVAEPAIAADILSLQQRLAATFAGGATPMAAAAQDTPDAQAR